MALVETENKYTASAEVEDEHEYEPSPTRSSIVTVLIALAVENTVTITVGGVPLPPLSTDFSAGSGYEVVVPCTFWCNPGEKWKCHSTLPFIKNHYTWRIL